MRIKKRITAYTATVAATVGAAFALSASPAAAYWSENCDPGRACIVSATTAMIWNLDSCGHNPIRDYYGQAHANGNRFIVNYANGKYDVVQAWSDRPLDWRTLVTSVDVIC